MVKKDIEALADLLEIAGFENAMDLIESKIIPMAITENITVLNALKKYANPSPSEDQDTSSYHLHIALLQISASSLNKIEGIDVALPPVEKEKVSAKKPR